MNIEYSLLFRDGILGLLGVRQHRVGTVGNDLNTFLNTRLYLISLDLNIHELCAKCAPCP
jgi:hypothetical protein